MTKPRHKPHRATPERWYFKVVTNDGKSRIESFGPCDPEFGEALRALSLCAGKLDVAQLHVLVNTARRMFVARKGVRDGRSEG